MDNRIESPETDSPSVEKPKRLSLIGFLAVVLPLTIIGCGMLGALTGILRSFGAAGGADIEPSEKARLLAQGISRTINYGLGGVIIGVVGLVLIVFIRRYRRKSSHSGG